VWEKEHVCETCVDDVWIFLRHLDKVETFLSTVSATPESLRRLIGPFRSSVGLHRQQVQRHSTNNKSFRDSVVLVQYWMEQIASPASLCKITEL